MNNIYTPLSCPQCTPKQIDLLTAEVMAFDSAFFELVCHNIKRLFDLSLMLTYVFIDRVVLLILILFNVSCSRSNTSGQQLR